VDRRKTITAPLLAGALLTTVIVALTTSPKKTNPFTSSSTTNTYDPCSSQNIVKKTAATIAWQTSFDMNNITIPGDDQLLGGSNHDIVWAKYPTVDTEVVIDGRSFTVKEAINSPDDNDLGGQASNDGIVRLRGASTAYIYTNTVFSAISDITFDAKYYSDSHNTAVFKVQTSTDKSTWTDVQTVTLSSSWNNISVSINKSNVYLRFNATVKTVNLDNLIVYSSQGGADISSSSSSSPSSSSTSTVNPSSSASSSTPSSPISSSTICDSSPIPSTSSASTTTSTSSSSSSLSSSSSPSSTSTASPSSSSSSQSNNGMLIEDTDPTLRAYYSTVYNKTGDALKTALKTLITVTPDSYEQAKTTLQYADQDPDNHNNILTIYNRASLTGPWTSGGTIWNREHVWPQSKLSGNASNDTHNLRAADNRPGSTVNGDRGNLAFGAGSGTFGKVNGLWWPGDYDKGDVARISMYMALRYDMTLSTNVSASLALQWNTEDPVDFFESNRNSVIYSYQGNRNPFIDHPELATILYG